MNARTDIPLGLVHDMPIADYHGSEGISNTALGDFAKSPRHYHALHLNPLRPPPPKEKPSQLDGNLAHCAFLEPEAFDKRYSVGPTCNRNTKLWTAFVDSLPTGVKAIQEDQRQTAFAQAESLASLPDIAALRAKGRAEVSAYWVDPVTGLLCRCRPDFVSDTRDDAVILVDVKTCGDASPGEFARQIARMGYHRQDAHYSDGFEIASGKKVLGFVFAAVEDKWPFAASAVMLDEESIERGRAENRALLDRLAECKRSGTWPCYSNAIELVTLPRWATAEPLPTTTEESAP